MKNKKIIGLLRNVFLITLLITVIFSAMPVHATGIVEVVFGKVSAKSGEYAVVPVTITNNPGFAAFRFRINYDADALEFVSVEKGEVLNNGTLSSKVDDENQTVTFTWLSVENSNSDGVVALLKFKVADNAKGKYALAVTYLAEDFLNENLEQIPYVVTDGEISTLFTVSGNVSVDDVTVKLLENNNTIAEMITVDRMFLFENVPSGTYIIEATKANYVKATYEVVVDGDVVQNLKLKRFGDVNGDTFVNKKDDLAMRKYLADPVFEINLDAANVFYDAAINKKDLLRLKQYLADPGIDLGV